jgi:hypothetical protein
MAVVVSGLGRHRNWHKIVSDLIAIAGECALKKSDE